MKSFIINRHGRIVLPSSFQPAIDFSSLESLEQLSATIRRDFEDKAPSGAELLRRIESGAYRTRYELLRDLALHLYWVDRFAITMYEKRSMPWYLVPKRRDDVFLPALAPWQDGEQKVAAVQAEYARLPSTWSAEAEYRIFTHLFDVFRHRRHQAAELPPILPTVAEALENPDSLTLQVGLYDPDFPTFSRGDIVDCHEEVPELEALMRWAMVLYNQYPWHREHIRLVELAKLRDDDVVVALYPRSGEVLEFIRRVRPGEPARRPRHPPHRAAPRPARAYRALRVRGQCAIAPRIEAVAAVKGEILCTNLDIVRNAAFSWSPMRASDILEKTGIESRCYTTRPLEEISLEAARRALEHAGRAPEEIGAVVFCTCTNVRLMPSVAAWISGQLGMLQTHASFDLVAACAGMVYGIAECVRLLQEVDGPVVLVCGEKFSDKVGNVRPSRMIFADGAAALVIAPAPRGSAPDVEVIQTYAGGSLQEVNSIFWPNPQFDNSVTVYGPDVHSLVARYLTQIMEELRAARDPDDPSRSLAETIDLIVPHQANRTMVTRLAAAAGVPPEKLYFNISRVGNTSAASIPIAISDAVREGWIGKPARILAPGFGAGAVAGYAIMRVDPQVIAPQPAGRAGRCERSNLPA